MATETANFDNYKLNTEFNEDYVVHAISTAGSGVVDVSETVETWKRGNLIGKGEFASVWLHEEVVTGKRRAMKKILRENLGNIDLSRELQVLIEVRDYRYLFVRFFGWYEDQDFTYLAMEYVEHGNLGQRLKDSGPKTEADAKEITRQLLQGLTVLHERGIYHRDLKPQIAAKGDFEAVMGLLAKNASVTEFNTCGEAALKNTAKNSHMKVVRLLLGKRADLGAVDRNGRSALHGATFRGHEVVVKLLLEEEAVDLSLFDQNGISILHYATFEGYLRVVELLLENGVDLSLLDGNRASVLHLASMQGHQEVVKVLLKKGADCNMVDRDGVSALHLAAAQGHVYVAELLLEQGRA